MRIGNYVAIIICIWISAFILFLPIEFFLFREIIGSQLGNSKSNTILFKWLPYIKLIYWLVPPSVTIKILRKINRLKKGEDL